MSTRVKELDEKCKKCGYPMEEVSVKTCWVDDFVVQCSNFDCSNDAGVSNMYAASARRARAEG